jgi:hypothetical protein
MWETKPRTTPRKTSGLLMGSEQVTRTKTCKLYDDDDDVSFTHLQLLNNSLRCTLKVTGRASKGSRVIAIRVRASYRLRRFQEAEVARFRDNRHMNVVTLAGLRTGCLYPQEKFLIFISVEG